MPRSDPPDWALPAWDAIDGEPSVPGDRSGRASPKRPDGRGTSDAREPARGDPHAIRAAPGTVGLRILSVSDVTRTIRSVVGSDERLRDVWVEGEIGRVTISSAGHGYFVLRDERNQLQCVWLRDTRMASAFEARTGLRVVVHGRIDLYEPSGALQLYVDGLQPAGFGDLALRLEALKARLAAEGLFEARRKRSLPERPAVVGVVTSPTGAVWHDIRTVLRRRWPLVQVVFVPCQVQGEAAAGSIAGALGRLGRWIERCAADGRPEAGPAVTILARGGGSLEDLWPFNEEAVVRAIVAHPVPVVCGVGHEVDTTLADFAADVRAPTPSAAAELVVPDRAELEAGLAAAGRRLDGLAGHRLGTARSEVAAERRALERLDPRAQLVMDRERVGRLLDRATSAIRGRLDETRRRQERLGARLIPSLPGRVALARAALEAGGAALAVLGPAATLERGYAIVRRGADGAIVRGPEEAPPGSLLRLTVARGEIRARSEEADR
jgi:exodeoxyribonuclease VII large subunit